MTLETLGSSLDTAAATIAADLAGEQFSEPGPAQLVEALRTQVSVASVLDDVFRLLGIESPAIVRQAVEGGA